MLIINTAPDEYYLATNGSFPFRVFTKEPGANIAAPAIIDRGYFNDGKWILSHRYNGDDIRPIDDLSGAAANHHSGHLDSPGLPRPIQRRGVNRADDLRVKFYQYH